MPAILLSILGPFVPYLMAALAAVGAYFFIKRKGKQEVREEVAKVQVEAKIKQAEQVVEAINKDAAIDQKVKQQIEEVKKVEENPPTTYSPGDIFKF